ncbi:MAG: hypothetical protein IJ479_02615 [Alphaproteobacteria bacterium]|nr:hypothetical protein [Alphaproteobacteria bacterium]
MKSTMLHMKSVSAVSIATFTAGLSVFLPSSVLAGICFLPDCELGIPNFDDVNSDSSWCEDNGYYFRCPDGMAPDYSQTCSRDESYTKCTAEQYCKNKGYTKSSQSCYDLGPVWYPHQQCPNGLDWYKECRQDTAQACKDNGYVNNCSRPDKTELCKWNPSYAKCCNDTPSKNCPANSKVTGCESGAIVGKDSCGYDCRQCCQTTCSSGYNYTDAQTSGGTTGYIKDGTDYCDHCTRGKLYKRKKNPCTGYSTCSSYGGVDNGDYCYTGSTKKYSQCRDGCQNGYIEWCSAPVTNCATLGYSQTSSACSGKPSIACPFDKTKWYCEETDSDSNEPTPPIGKACCGYTNYCGYNNGTSHSSDSRCQSSWGMSCYNKCMSIHDNSCNDWFANCRASGHTLVFQGCVTEIIGGTSFTCE